MKTELEKERGKLADLADCYLTGHDKMTAEQKQVLFKELEHQRERLTRLKNPKKNNDD